MAIEHGIQYDKCQLDSENKLACQLDKALANVGSIFAGQVEGRVSTEVDPRHAYDTGINSSCTLWLPVCLCCYVADLYPHDAVVLFCVQVAV